MDQIEFGGITFRSSVHLIWFLFSVGVLVVASAASAGLGFWKRRHPEGPNPILVWEYPLYLHVTVAVVAAILTRGGQIEYGSYSRDCIWWNAAMAGSYWIVLVVAKRRARRRAHPS